MKNDELNQVWKSQRQPLPQGSADQIVKMANKQRKRQFIGVGIMGLTVLVLLAYALLYAPAQWNNFTLGLLLMIGSLSFRIILELVSVLRKESRMITLDGLTFKAYLKRFYRIRMWVNYTITPLCMALYCYGFILLLPYFKQEFSKGFYTYLLISGFGSLAFITIIIVRVIRREHRFLKQLVQ